MTACIEWQGHRDRDGYGRQGRKLAHRVAYERECGAIPEGYQLHHVCRNRACVNPTHLEPVLVSEHPVTNPRAGTPICINGHEYTPENTYVNPSGRRICKACRRESDAVRCRDLTTPMRDLLWKVAQHKYGWAHASRRRGQIQVAEALIRRGLVDASGTHDWEYQPIIVATAAGCAEIERCWPVSPFALGTYDHQPEEAA